MVKRSELERKARRFGLCPYCKSFMGMPSKYLDKDGHYVKVTFTLGRATFRECPKCGKRWPLFADYEDAPSSDTSIVETSRSEELIGNETRRVENKTPATIQRTVRASQEWTYQIEVDITRATLNSSEKKLAIKGADLTSQVQKSVQKRYNISLGETKKFEEEVLITIPGNTSVEAVFIWKRIWQNGYVELEMGEARVPFRLCVGVTFDFASR